MEVISIHELIEKYEAREEQLDKIINAQWFGYSMLLQEILNDLRNLVK